MDRQFDLSFTSGIMGVDFADMDLRDYTVLELQYMLSQINDAQQNILFILDKKRDNK